MSFFLIDKNDMIIRSNQKVFEYTIKYPHSKYNF